MLTPIARLVAPLALLVGAAATLPACGGNVAVEPPSKSPGDTGSTKGKPADSAPPSIERPTDYACSYAGSATAMVSLRTRAGGPPFVHFAGKRIGAYIPKGPASHAVVEVTDGALELRGFVEPSDIDLRADRAFVMNEFVIPERARLSWIEGGHDSLTVTIPAPAAIIPAKPPLTAQITCPDARLRAFGQDPPSAEFAIFEEREGQVMRLRNGLETTLSSTFDGPPVATLRVPEEKDVVITVYEARGERSRIGWSLEGLFIFGWINTAGLIPPPRGVSHRGAAPDGYFGARFVELPTVDQVWCYDDIPIIADVAGQKATVGTIHGESVVSIVQWGGALSRVWWYKPSWMEDNFHMATDWLVPAENAALVARTSALRRCVPLTRREIP